MEVNNAQPAPSLGPNDVWYNVMKPAPIVGPNGSINYAVIGQHQFIQQAISQASSIPGALVAMTAVIFVVPRLSPATVPATK